MLLECNSIAFDVLGGQEDESDHQCQGTEITVLSKGDENDFISLTDIARYKNPDEPKDVVKNWMRSRSTIEFLGLWEKLNNPDFKGVECDSFIHEAGSNAFTLSPQQWISTTNAVGLLSKSGRYGGTFAHKLSHLNLRPGFPPSSSSTSSRIISALRQMKTAGSPLNET